MVESKDEWIEKQFREAGWSDEKIKRGQKYNRGLIYGGIGGLMCIFIITALFGLPLLIFGLYRAVRYNEPGKDYREGKKQLEKEFERRDESGEPLWDDVGEDWWANRTTVDI